jgi:hypothetical protein
MLEECRWAQVWAEGMEQTLLLSQEWAEQTHGWAGPLTNHPVKTSSTLATLYILHLGTDSSTGTRCSRDVFSLGRHILYILYTAPRNTFLLQEPGAAGTSLVLGTIYIVLYTAPRNTYLLYRYQVQQGHPSVLGTIYIHTVHTAHSWYRYQVQQGRLQPWAPYCTRTPHLGIHSFHRYQVQ